MKFILELVEVKDDRIDNSCELCLFENYNIETDVFSCICPAVLKDIVCTGENKFWVIGSVKEKEYDS